MITATTTFSTLILTACLSSFVSVDLSAQSATTLTVPDYTDSLVLLGAPAATRQPGVAKAYARNVWDLTLFDGQLYIGAGNSSNYGPNQNAGPVPILAYNLANQTFGEEFLTWDEQIDQFRLLNNTLVIAGHDSYGGIPNSSALGNYYFRQGKSWVRNRTIPDALHLYDLYQFNGIFFAGLGTNGRKPPIWQSTGINGPWKPVQSPNSFRIFQFFEDDKLLYGAAAIGYSGTEPVTAYYRNDPQFGRAPVSPDSAFYAGIYAYNGTQFIARHDLTGRVLFPDTPEAARTKVGKLIRPVAFRGQLIYIGGAIWNDHQTQPFGLYLSESLALRKSRIRRIAPPVVSGLVWPFGAVPWDVLVDGEYIYALWSVKRHLKGDYTIYVTRSADLQTWQALFTVDYPTFARSFAKNGNTFFLGMGTGIGPADEPWQWEIREQSGDLLQVTTPIK